MIPLFELQPLPFSGSPYSGESGNGFFLRMAEANGLELHEFFTLLRRDPSRQLHPKDAPILARLFDCPVSELESVFVTSSYDKHCVQRFDFCGHLVTRMYLLDLRHPKVCPQCLADFGYARVEWDLSLFIWCPIHQATLIERCPACSNRLSWFRQGISICSCGCRLDRVAKAEEQPHSVRAMSALLSRFISNPQMPCLHFPREFDEVLRVLSAMSFDGAMRFIWILGVESGSSGGFANARRRREMSAAALIIEVGFARLQSLLQRASHSSDLGDMPASTLLINALRRMVEDGATEGDRHFAKTCIDLILPPRLRKKSGVRRPAVDQLPLLFEDR